MSYLEGCYIFNFPLYLFSLAGMLLMLLFLYFLHYYIFLICCTFCSILKLLNPHKSPRYFTQITKCCCLFSPCYKTIHTSHTHTHTHYPSLLLSLCNTTL